MQLDAFEQARESLDISEVARFYGIDVDSNGKSRCIFHNEKTPSLSFKGTYYKCFGCGEGGDAIKLTQHLFGYTRPMDALKRLNDDFNLNLDLGGKSDPIAACKRISARDRLTAFNEWIENACRVWAKYCRQLWAWKRDCAPSSPDEPFDQRFVEACHKIDYADYIYMSVFIDGDFETKARFYHTHRKEVEALDRNQSGQTGVA